MRRNDDDEARVKVVVATVLRVDPGLAEHAVLTALFAAPPTEPMRVEVDRELAVRPSVLTVGRSAGRPATRRLIDGLVAAGSTAVRPPRCTLCRRVTALPTALSGGGRACAGCRDLLQSEPCQQCGTWGRLSRRPSDRLRVCAACRHPDREAGSDADVGPSEGVGDVGTCSGCGLRHRLSCVRPDGTRICRRCDQRELAEWLRGWRVHFRRPPQRVRLHDDPKVNDEIRIGWIVEAVAAADPDLPETAVRSVLSEVAPRCTDHRG